MGAAEMSLLTCMSCGFVQTHESSLRDKAGKIFENVDDSDETFSSSCIRSEFVASGRSNNATSREKVLCALHHTLQFKREPGRETKPVCKLPKEARGEAMEKSPADMLKFCVLQNSPSLEGIDEQMFCDAVIEVSQHYGKLGRSSEFEEMMTALEAESIAYMKAQQGEHAARDAAELAT